MKPRLLLVDAYSQIYRGFYAVRSLSTSDGRPSNAVFAMTKLLLKLEHDYPDADGAFVFDKGKCASRLALAPAYKANRPPMPEELRSQIEPLREMIGAFGWSIVEYEGHEADDLIAGAAKAFPGCAVWIVSSDKDISQVIDSRVKMLVPDRDGKGFRERGREETIEKFGVPPEGLVDYLSLVGDSSDNIPGVDGVGPKTASALIREHGSIDSMLENPEKIEKLSLREKIIAAGERLTLNRKLIRLDDAPPCADFFHPENFVRKEPDAERALSVAERLELKSLYRELETFSSPAKGKEEEMRQMEFGF